MKAEIFNTPQCLNMGFHYTIQFSRRTRIRVMGLVDQSSEEWTRWYMRMHEPAALQEIADAGYTIIEIHFLYGFGLESESEEWQRTRKMVRNAHKAGLKVFGYFQFFSVQEETFFLENPWAGECVQVDSEGKRIQYRYDRPALCFSHPRVRQYYLDGIELGLKDCDLDGIRLDNDYYRGCYCPNCQNAFRKWLKEHFDEDEAKRIFGLPTTEGMSLVPQCLTHDPLWMATVLFNQSKRQNFMRELSEKIHQIKPNAILGGNPALNRRFTDPYRVNVYPPDLGETHHLVCAENLRFPARIGESIRHQVMLYKYAQANSFAVFASHHLQDADGKARWPESINECVLSFCEGLAFGGHPVTTTWGLRMDGTGDKILYQRPMFRKALNPIADFLKKYSTIYHEAVCNAPVGIYQNRESLCMDSRNAWLSLQGTVQTLLQHQIPFRFIDRDDETFYVDGFQMVIVPDMQYVSKAQINRFHSFAKRGGKLLITGSSCRFDEWGLAYERNELDFLWEHPNVTHLQNTPEKITFPSEQDFSRMVGEESGGKWHKDLPLPPEHVNFANVVRELYSEKVRVCGSGFVAVDTFANPTGEQFLHILNYDNDNPCDVSIEIDGDAKNIECFMPDGLGTKTEPIINTTESKTTITLPRLHTYCVISYKPV